MAQHLKPSVQTSIADAALEIFARKGFQGASVAEIASSAGVSTGNVYRYYKDKADLFYTLLPKEFVATFLDLMRRRVKVLERAQGVQAQGGFARYHLISDELLDFCVANRQRVVILLGKAAGTRYEGFAEEMSQVLIMLAIAYFRAVTPSLKVTSMMSFNLDQIFRNFTATTVSILRDHKSESEIHEALEGLSRYHSAGLKALFEQGIPR